MSFSISLGNFNRKNYSVTVVKSADRPCRLPVLLGMEMQPEASCSLPGICKQEAEGNNCFPDSLDAAEIPFSVIPFLNLTKTTTTQILGNCHFPYSIGSFITMAVQLFFWAKELTDFSILLTQMLLKTWGSLGTAYGYFSRLRLSPSHSCWGREQSKQREEQNWDGATEMPRGADSEGKLHYPCQAWGQADLPFSSTHKHSHHHQCTPLGEQWKCYKCRVEWVLSPSLMLTSPTAKWRQPGPGSVIYTLAVNPENSCMRNPVRRSSNKGSTSPSWLLKFVLLEGLGVHFLFLVCSFAFTFFLRQKKHIWLKITHFPSLGLRKQGQRLWTLL